MLKYYIPFLFGQFTKILNSFFFFTYVGQTKIWKLCKFDLSHFKVSIAFEVHSLDNILVKGHYLKNVKYHIL